VVNKTANPLRVLSGPWCMIRRIRIMCQGVAIEDLDFYARLHQMFDVMRSKHVRKNEAAEAFDNSFDEDTFRDYLTSSIKTNTNPSTWADNVTNQGVKVNTFPNYYIQLMEIKLKRSDLGPYPAY
jgi:hypothetical protein